MRLRQDNADRRLTPIAAKLGLVSDERGRSVEEKEKAISDAIQKLAGIHRSDGPDLLRVLRRPEVKLADLQDEAPWLRELSHDVREQIEIDAKYAGYLERQDRDVAKLHKLESKSIPPGIEYASIEPLRKEAREKFARYQPETIGQAGRIAGISPADVGVLEVYLRTQP